MSHHITIFEDPMKFQDMFDQAMHQNMINQPKVMTNSGQNTIYQMMNGNWTPGFTGPCFSQIESSAIAARRTSASPAGGIGRHMIRSYATSILLATGISIRGDLDADGSNLQQ